MQERVRRLQIGVFLRGQDLAAELEAVRQYRDHAVIRRRRHGFGTEHGRGARLGRHQCDTPGIALARGQDVQQILVEDDAGLVVLHERAVLAHVLDRTVQGNLVDMANDQATLELLRRGEDTPRVTVRREVGVGFLNLRGDARTGQPAGAVARRIVGPQARAR